MTENQLAIIEKVKKLLRLAENAGSDAEAHSAARQAQELLSKYHLSMSQVGDKWDDLDCGESDGYDLKASSVPNHVKFLISGINESMSVRAIINCTFARKPRSVGKTNCVRFVGILPDCIIAQQLFEFLYEFGLRSARRERLTGARRASFLCGFALAVGRRLVERRKQAEESDLMGNALVPVMDAALNRYMEKHYPDIQQARQPRSVNDSLSLHLGVRYGNTVSLDRPVESSDRKALSV